MRQLCAQLHTALILPRAAFGCTAGPYILFFPS